MSKAIRNMKPWPAGMPLPAGALTFFYHPGLDDEFNIDPARFGKPGGGSATIALPISLEVDAPALVAAGKVDSGIFYAITGTHWNGNDSATVHVHGLNPSAFAPVGYVLDSQDQWQLVQVDVAARLVDTEAIRDAHLVQYGQPTLDANGQLQVPLLLGPAVTRDAVFEELLMPLPGSTTPTTPTTPTNPGTGKTNLLTNTDLTDPAAWSAGDMGVTGGQPDPAGGTSAVLAVPNVINTSNHNLRSFGPLKGYAAGRQMSYVLEGKAAGYRYVSLWVVQDNFNNTLGMALFDLQTGTVVNNPGGTAITPVALAGGFYRMQVDFTANGADFFLFPKIWDNTTDTSYAGDGISGVYLVNPALQDA